MNKIFWGLLLIFLNFNLGVNGHSIDILPNFAGYLLIASGMEEVTESAVFAAARPMVLCTALYAAALWVMDLLGVSLGGITIGLGMASLVLQLLVTYRIAEGVAELEPLRQRDLNALALHNGWIVIAVGSAVSYVFGIFPVPILSVVAMVVSFVAAVYYIVKFYQSKEVYLADGGEQL